MTIRSFSDGSVESADQPFPRRNQDAGFPQAMRRPATVRLGRVSPMSAEAAPLLRARKKRTRWAIVAAVVLGWFWSLESPPRP